MDRFTSLAILVSAVEQGSLAGAARARGMTPAMAGKHVAALEAALGVRLLHRTTRKLQPTEAGREYGERARAILEALDGADRLAREGRNEPRGVLRVAAPAGFGALYLGAPTAEFLRRYPAVQVRMTLEDRDTDLVAGGYDLAVRIGDRPDSSLVTSRIASTTMIACAAPDFLDERGRPDSIEALSCLDRLAFSGARPANDWSFTAPDGRSGRVDGPVRLLADDVRLLAGAAVAGAGVAYGPAFAFAAELRDGRLERLLPDHGTSSLGIHAVFPTARLVGVSARRFADTLRGWFAGTPSWED